MPLKEEIYFNKTLTTDLEIYPDLGCTFVENIKTNKMKRATYTNTATNEVYTLLGEKMDIQKAHSLAGFVCERMNWNINMFGHDVRVRVA